MLKRWFLTVAVFSVAVVASDLLLVALGWFRPAPVDGFVGGTIFYSIMFFPPYLLGRLSCWTDHCK
jgi:hypothetical protein